MKENGQDEDLYRKQDEEVVQDGEKYVQIDIADDETLSDEVCDRECKVSDDNEISTRAQENTRNDADDKM